MKLLSVIHGPVFGGAQMQLLRLRGPLAAHDWETIAVAPEEPGNAVVRMREAGVDVTVLPLHRMRATPNPVTQARFVASFWPEITRLRHVIRERRIDLVQAHGPTNPHAAIAAHLEGVAVVWQIYDTVAPMALRRATMPLVVRLADVITTWGRELARTHPGALDLGDRLVTVFPPVESRDFEWTAGERAAARRRLNVPEDATLIGTVGVRNPTKGHAHLVQAAEIVRRKRPDAVFRVLGGPSPVHGAYDARVLREARGRGLGDPGVLDFVDPRGEVPKLLPAFDVFVMTSVPRSEGIPTAILEAMATGLPVVTTDVGAIRELVEDGVTGIVVPPLDPEAVGSALLRILADDELRSGLGAEGRRRAREQYDLGSLAQRHLRAYEMALEHRALRRQPGSVSR